jgi:hypothetical protein
MAANQLNHLVVPGPAVAPGTPLASQVQSSDDGRAPIRDRERPAGRDDIGSPRGLRPYWALIAAAHEGPEMAGVRAPEPAAAVPRPGGLHQAGLIAGCSSGGTAHGMLHRRPI